MIRQEVVVCQRCGALRELSYDCECSKEKGRSLKTVSSKADRSMIGSQKKRRTENGRKKL